jgi:hypothetical protein
MIKGLRDVLEDFSKLDEVKAIFPGKINTKRGYSNKAFFKIRKIEKTGIRCAFENEKAIQDVFIVIQNDDNTRTVLLSEIEKRFPEAKKYMKNMER